MTRRTLLLARLIALAVHARDFREADRLLDIGTRRGCDPELLLCLTWDPRQGGYRIS